MKMFITYTLLGLFGAMIIGCDSMDTTDSNGPRHETVEKKTVTDPNGNVVQHTERKSVNDSNNP